MKEYIPRFEDGDPRGNLLTLHMTSFRLARKYGYFIDGKWKRIAQAVGRALDGKCEEQWDDLCDAEAHWGTGNSRDQEIKFRRMLQKHSRLVLEKTPLTTRRTQWKRA